jgi:hypothetical protein
MVTPDAVPGQDADEPDAEPTPDAEVTPDAVLGPDASPTPDAYVPFCGDNAVNGSEQCDGQDLDGQTCDTLLGLVHGQLACASDCTAFDTSDCHACPNGIVEGPEQCDDGTGPDWDGCRFCEIVEFNIHETFTASQQFPAVAMAGDGSFVTVYDSAFCEGVGPGTLCYRQFDDNGVPLGGEQRMQNGARPDIAVAPDGSFVIAYDDDSTFDGDVFVQRFTSTGVPIGPAIQVNTHDLFPHNCRNASVSTAGDGSFVTVWQSDDQDGSGWGIYGQRFDNAGNKVGTEFLVNTTTTGSQTEPDVVSFDNGAFVVTWASGFEVYGQRYSSSGNPVAGEFFIGDGSYPDVARSGDQFVIAWKCTMHVCAQRYAANGSPLGVIQVTATPGNYEYPAVAAAPNGTFAVTWTGNDGDGLGVEARRYGSSGQPLGTPFAVNLYTQADQWYSRIAMSDPGNVLVVWHSDGQDNDQYGIFAQRFNAAGEPRGRLVW